MNHSFLYGYHVRGGYIDKTETLTTTTTASVDVDRDKLKSKVLTNSYKAKLKTRMYVL